VSIEFGHVNNPSSIVHLLLHRCLRSLVYSCRHFPEGGPQIGLFLHILKSIVMELYYKALLSREGQIFIMLCGAMGKSALVV
jgi:hypothetical protein